MRLEGLAGSVVRCNVNAPCHLCKVLVVAPTREIAVQICGVIQTVGTYVPPEVSAVGMH